MSLITVSPAPRTALGVRVLRRIEAALCGAVAKLAELPGRARDRAALRSLDKEVLDDLRHDRDDYELAKSMWRGL